MRTSARWCARALAVAVLDGAAHMHAFAPDFGALARASAGAWACAPAGAGTTSAHRLVGARYFANLRINEDPVGSGWALPLAPFCKARLRRARPCAPGQPAQRRSDMRLAGGVRIGGKARLVIATLTY